MIVNDLKGCGRKQLWIHEFSWWQWGKPQITLRELVSEPRLKPYMKKDWQVCNSEVLGLWYDVFCEMLPCSICGYLPSLCVTITGLTSHSWARSSSWMWMRMDLWFVRLYPGESWSSWLIGEGHQDIWCSQHEGDGVQTEEAETIMMFVRGEFVFHILKEWASYCVYEERLFKMQNIFPFAIIYKLVTVTSSVKLIGISESFQFMESKGSLPYSQEPMTVVFLN
jgi:hypothetical protein